MSQSLPAPQPIIDEIYALQHTLSNLSNEVDLFPHVFAFVFINDGKPDTLYADRALKLFEWKGRKKFYKGTSSFFNNIFHSISSVK